MFLLQYFYILLYNLFSETQKEGEIDRERERERERERGKFMFVGRLSEGQKGAKRREPSFEFRNKFSVLYFPREERDAST